MAPTWYATREDVKSALDVAETARNNRQVDRCVDSGARAVRGLLHRDFRPITGTRYFDWPNHQLARPWRLWLGRDELVSIDQLVAGGVTVPSTDYFLEPANSGPPFTRLEIDLDSPASFGTAGTHQRAIAVTGVFGHSNDEEQIGTLAGTLAAGAGATAAVTWNTARFGVGDVLRIDNERMMITEKTMVDSTQNLGGSLPAAANSVTVAVSNGAAFDVDGVILVDAERMLVVDIAGNNLIVRRAFDGSVLATHNAGADVFTLFGVELARGQLGTVDASHSAAATIWRHIVPGLVRELNVAEAINTLQQETAGYARTIGAGENEREIGGRGLADIRREAISAFGRRSRARAV